LKLKKCKIKIEDNAFPFVMLLVILLGLASLELDEVVTSSSSSPSWREFDHEFLSPISKGERSLTLKYFYTHSTPAIFLHPFHTYNIFTPI